MDLNREALEGGARLAQVRRTKKILIIVQVVIVLVAVIILTTIDGQIHLDPFYYNIGSFLYIVILMALIIGLEGFIFKMLELRFIRSTSEKYYILKGSARRSIIVIIIAAVVLVLLLTPFVANSLANLNSESGKTSSVAGFINHDPLGLTTVDSIVIKSDEPTEVLVMTEANYLTYAGNMTLMRQHSTLYTTSSAYETTIDFPQTPFEQYYLVVDPEHPYPVTYTVHKDLSSTFVGTATFFSALFIGFYSIWVISTYRLKKDYAKGAIYR